MRASFWLIPSVSLTLALAACGDSKSRQLGAEVDEGGFGQTTAYNSQVMSGEINAAQILASRFASEVPSTITFEFNSAVLSPEAQQVLVQQASWIRQFPELRFSVYGHTDLVGSDSYNKRLGQRRAEAVVAFFATQGIERARLDALVSLGKTAPVVMTQGPEQANRRTVTQVTGFYRRDQLLEGRYAEVIGREYIQSGTRPHPQNTVIQTQVDPGQGGN